MDKAQYHAVAVIALVALLVVLPLYALSLGPAWTMVQNDVMDRQTFDVVYGPVLAIPVVGERLKQYAYWCEAIAQEGGYGVA
jgi:hypothetical protein